MPPAEVGSQTFDHAAPPHFLACSYQSRKANLDIKHGFRLEDGRLIPKTWMQAKRNIAAGEVL
jgi:hypothetical protein